MKLKHSIALCSLAFGVVAGRAQDIKVNLPAQGDQAAGNTAAAATFTDTQIAEELGWFYGKRMGLSELEFTPGELDALIKGLQAAAAGKDAPYDLEKIGPKVDEFMQKKQSAYMTKLKGKNAAESEKFFAQLKENKNVVALPSGLHYEIVQQGSGPTPKATDRVKVHYTGTLIDGTVFDSSRESGTPLTIGLNEVVPGWTEGLQKLQKGGKMKLYIPANLGYGDRGSGQIPPGSTLIFDVELLDVNPPAEGSQPQALPPLPSGK